MASDPVRIELRDVAARRDEAQRDLQETLGALEEKLLPRRAARRLLMNHNAPLVLIGAAAAGAALGLARSPGIAGRTAAACAAVTAGLIFYQVAREA